MFLVFVVVMVVVVCSHNGKVEAADFTGYIPISSADDLQKLNYSYDGSKFYLTKDIDLSTYGYWTSIKDFKGILDGNGHKIDNLTSTTGGLFASLYPGATVRNIVLTNVNISVSSPEEEGVGGIVGKIDETDYEAIVQNRITTTTTIENCYVSGNCSVKMTDNNYTGIAGILGKGVSLVGGYDDGSEATIGYINISGCVNEMNIDVSYSTLKGGYNDIYAGGILGADFSSTATIKNSYNLGQISLVANTSSAETDIHIGGVVGVLAGKMSNCYSYSCLSGINYTKGDSFCGSLVGTASETAVILSCYYFDNTGSSIGETKNALYSGDFISDYNKSQISEYKGWDFNSIWLLTNGINGGHPILQWMEPYYKVESPYSNMTSGSFTKTFRVEMFDDVEGATIYYTTDGTTPTNLSNKYSASISINKDTTLKMIAIYKNFAQSEVVTYKYTFACVSPTANYESGKSFSKETSIKLATKEKNAIIYYTIDGKKPTIKSKKYTGPITISKDTVIKAISIVTGKKNSEVVTLYYYVSADTPTSNSSSGTYASSLHIKLKTATKGATIYYTTNGKIPTNKSKKYTGTFTVSKNTVVKAIAINGKVKSNVATWTYNVKAGTPFSNKVSGYYKDMLTIKLSTNTSGATIYYTTDGTKPSVYSLRYTGEIKIYNTTEIKAVAIKDGMVSSDIFSCNYSVY